MAGALYDIDTTLHSWSVGTVATGGTIQDGVTLAAGRRLLSAFGYIQFGGGGTKALAVQKYEFGDIYGYETSEGCWARYLVEADVTNLGGTAYLYVIHASETNPE